MKRPPLFTRRRILAAAAASVGATRLYTWGVEPHWLQLVRREMPIRNLPRQLEGATLAQLSDLHVGPQVDDHYLLSVFERVRQLSPQVVVYTGDFISNNTDVRDHAPRILSRLPLGTLGTVGILGNHDYGPGWFGLRTAALITSIVQKAGVQILRNELTEVSGLTIAGMDDLWAKRFAPKAVLPQVNPQAASLALVHNPDAVDLPGWDGYSGWILSGHTHGGQCKPPFLPPPLLPVMNRRYTCGDFALTGGRRMYISCGVGHLTRVRFNVRPEVTLFTLVRATTEV